MILSLKYNNNNVARRSVIESVMVLQRNKIFVGMIYETIVDDILNEATPVKV